MPEGPLIIDRAYLNSAEWLAQKNNPGGFSGAAAWIDLLGLLNNTGAVIPMRGQDVEVDRGQCAWSKFGLAERWGWSQSKTASQLLRWEKPGRITVDSNNQRTIITAPNYDSYQSLLESRPRADREQTATEQRANRDRVGEGEGVHTFKGGEKGEGKGNPPPDSEVPSDDDVLAFARSYRNLSVGITSGIPDAWSLPWIAMMLDQKRDWRYWQRSLVTRFRADFGDPSSPGHARAHGLNGFQKRKNPGDGELSPNVLAIADQKRRGELQRELGELQEEIEALDSAGAPVPDEKKSREKQILSELAT